MSDPLWATIRRPISVLAGALLLVVFGGLAVFKLPVQLTPTVEAPEITVITNWPGASPFEIEREIILRQEEQLENIPGLLRLHSSSDDSQGVLVLTFDVETDVQSALVQVANRLQQVESHPVDALRPVVEAVGTNSNNIAWFMLQPSGDKRFSGDVTELGDLAEDIIEPRLERIAGVARVTNAGARKEQLEIRVDLSKLAARRLTLDDLASALDRESKDWSAGDIERGVQRLVVRTAASYRSLEDVRAVPIAMRDGVSIRIADVAGVELAHQEASELGFFLGKPAIGINVQKQAGANVLHVMKDIRAVAAEINKEVLAPLGLRMSQSYDETEYIHRAIALVRQSLLIGGILATIVLFAFLRSRSATFLVALTIPLSLLGACLVLWAVGSSLNILTLAGLAFAVGMVVDNAIVVLENIVRHRQAGASKRRAAYRGVSEVWGAVLASTSTTIAVFLPIVFVRSEMGQMFRDLAVAICAAVAFSLLVSVTVVPALSAKLLNVPGELRILGQSSHRRPTSLRRWAVRLGEALSHAVYRLCGATRSRLALIAAVTLLSLGGVWLLKPSVDYLPAGNRNFLFCFLEPTPGSNLTKVAMFQKPIVDRLEPLWNASTDRASELPGGGIRSLFFVAGPGFGMVGVRARDPERARELIPELEAATAEIEGGRSVVIQRNVFEDSYVEGRTLSLDLSGPDLEMLWTAAASARQAVEEALPGTSTRLEPNPGQQTPELRIVPDRRRIAELGIGSDEIGRLVSALVDGQRVGTFIHQGQELDLVIKAGESSDMTSWEALRHTPLATSLGPVVTLGSVASLAEWESPASIRRLDRQRTVTVQIDPPPDVPLATAAQLLRERVVTPLQESGVIESSMTARVAGSADQLQEAGRSMLWVILLAVALVYLLMAALFESFLFPLVIIWTVPLAAFGGFLGLKTVNLFAPQSLDVLTMLGFVVLIGTVVNNAILLVHQALQHRRRDDMGHRDAVAAAARNRIRPIFMSALTSIFGMLPLVLFPGAGAELYRGLGSVVVGGLAISTVLTLLVVPALLSLALEGRQSLRRKLRPKLSFLEDTTRFDLSAPTQEASSNAVAVDPSGTLDW